jgi:hypothetical protein
MEIGAIHSEQFQVHRKKKHTQMLIKTNRSIDTVDEIYSPTPQRENQSPRKQKTV